MPNTLYKYLKLLMQKLQSNYLYSNSTIPLSVYGFYLLIVSVSLMNRVKGQCFVRQFGQATAQPDSSLTNAETEWASLAFLGLRAGVTPESGR